MKMKLCFGTFGTVLSLCTINSRMNKKLVSTMTKIVDPTSRYNTAESSTITRLLKCLTDFADRTENVSQDSNRLGKIVSAARNAKIYSVIEEFERSVIILLSMDKKNQMVLSLLDIIEKDMGIDIEHKVSFKKYFGKTKKDLLSQNEYVLSDFLARILLYTAAEVDNTKGKPFIKTITEEYIADFENKRNSIIVWETTAHKLVQGDKNKTPSEKMFDIFNSATSECGIKKALENEDSDGVADVERFIEIIKFKIEPIEDFKNEIKYNEIMEFVQLLEELEIAVELKENLLSGFKSAADHVNYLFRRISNLYRKIIKEEIYKDISQNEVFVEDEINLKIFNAVTCKYGIENFLKIHPESSLLNFYLISEVEEFIKTINREIQKIQNKSIHMIKFIYKLDEYIKYLQNNMRPDDDNNLRIKAKPGGAKEVMEIVNGISRYRYSLHSLYKKVCGIDLSGVIKKG